MDGIWEGLGLADLPEVRGERVEEAMRGMSERERVIFMLGCWAIWERRNKAIFEGAEGR